MSPRRFDVRDLAAIGIGGAAGAGLRSWIAGLGSPSAGDGGWFTYAPNSSVSFQPIDSPLGTFDWNRFPWDTIIVNGLGCLLLGVVTVLLTRSTSRRRPLLALGTGFCGSLTTFSTFAVDTATLFRGQAVALADNSFVTRLPAERGAALSYLALSVAVGAAAFVVGRIGAHRTRQVSL